MSIDEVLKIAAVFGPDSLRTAIEQHVAEAVARETERLRGALLTLANAADDVGVQFFDMEDPPISVAQMESATLAARAALAALQETK
jgi:hypothetical protein